jgi:hypothetical protein
VVRWLISATISADTSRGMAKCPDTGITIPECSCPRCVEAQLMQVMPSLLRKDRKRPDERSGNDPGQLAA